MGMLEEHSSLLTKRTLSNMLRKRAPTLMAASSTQQSSQGSKKTRSTRTRVPRPLLRNKDFVSFGKGFPKQLQFTHRYYQNGSINSVAGAIASYNFRCNGMYDPDQSGVGHQPYYFDQLSALYDHYVVTASKITVTFGQYESTGGTHCNPGVVALWINDDNSAPSSFSTVVENSTAAVRVLPGDGSSTATLSKTWNSKAIFGTDVVGNPNFQGTSGTDPTELSNFTITVIGKAAVDTYITYSVVIEYTAVWTELTDVAGS